MPAAGITPKPCNPGTKLKPVESTPNKPPLSFGGIIVGGPNSDGAIVIYDAATGVAPDLPAGVEIEAFSVTIENAS